jgi:GNAT superfamily N-acetyltransferase
MHVRSDRQRLPQEARRANKAAFREVVWRGPPPGLLALAGEVAVGWCQLTPRDSVPALDRLWRLRRVDDVPVWSLSCLYVRKGYRRRGITAHLIAAALTAAKRANARPGGLSIRRGHLAERVRVRLCLHVRARRLQDGRLPRARTPNHAARSKRH